ncbi:hypothetical protein B0H34DRAFT_166491 [Crassisporium funariophilum]|nr:hypothetical protein B0H34DRAFT_166491 [Crassisporium funariophilum]
MLTSSIFYSVIAIASMAVSAIPSGPLRMMLVKREDMHCSSHNWTIMCRTTHHCDAGHVVRTNHMQTLNPECTHECNCGNPVATGGRKILGEIDHNTVNRVHRTWHRREGVEEDYLYE